MSKIVYNIAVGLGATFLGRASTTPPRRTSGCKVSIPYSVWTSFLLMIVGQKLRVVSTLSSTYDTRDSESGGGLSPGLTA